MATDFHSSSMLTHDVLEQIAQAYLGRILLRKIAANFKAASDQQIHIFHIPHDSFE